MARRTKEKSMTENTKDELLNLDNEIIIGIKSLPEQEAYVRKKNTNKKRVANRKKQYKKKNERTKQNKRHKIEKTVNARVQNNKNINRNRNKKTNKIRTFRIIKWTTICLLLVGGGIGFLLSPFFNVKEIIIIGNERIKKEELISLSGITLEENTFKIQYYEVQNKIKENAYIDKVIVRRKLPDKIEIEITERTPTYMLTLGNAYIYINNQGYLLETSKNALKVPIIDGFSTKEEELHPGNRLCSEDLQRLDQALQIMKSAESNGIGSLITKINVEDKQDYVLELKSEKKKIHIGDSSNLSTKMLYILSILEENKKVEGEIFVNTDLDNKGAIFRKKV